MIAALGRVTAAELVKLRGLPSVRAAVRGTAAGAVALAAAAASAAAAAARGPAGGVNPPDVVQVMIRTMPVLQVGPILLGVLAVATEYEGRQIVTSLTAMPVRPLFLVGKSLAALGMLTASSVASIGLGLAFGRVVLAARDVDQSPSPDVRAAAGAAGYLVLIGLLSFALAAALRSLVAPLVLMLSLVLVISPLVAARTEHARWLPDRAGSLLYRPDADPVLTPTAGGLLLLGWIAVTATTAAIAFSRRDA
jgi:hypothetical protein